MNAVEIINCICAYPLLGIYVYAILGELKPFKNVMRGTYPARLTLSAGWTQGKGFNLNVICPETLTVDLGRGIMTDPFRLAITLGSAPTLTLISGIKVPIEDQYEPLHFQIHLSLDVNRASATGHLNVVGGWENPFGISEDLVIGPDLALKVSIKWATFLAHGPDGFGFVGGLAMGKVKGQMAFNIEEVPSRTPLLSLISMAELMIL